MMALTKKHVGGKMAKFDQQEFINRIESKLINKKVPPCPYCGNQNFITSPEYATILSNTDLNNLNIGPHIPCGMIICPKCGHIEFFSLGILGMLTKESGDKNDK